MFRDGVPFSGPVDGEETRAGGKRKNTPKSKRRETAGRGAASKTAVVGATDRASVCRSTLTEAQFLISELRSHAPPGPGSDQLHYSASTLTVASFHIVERASMADFFAWNNCRHSRACAVLFARAYT